MKIPIRGRDNAETAENVSLLAVFLGVVLFAGGTVLSIFSPQGLSAALAMSGGFLILIFSLLFVVMWFFKKRGE